MPQPRDLGRLQSVPQEIRTLDVDARQLAPVTRKGGSWEERKSSRRLFPPLRHRIQRLGGDQYLIRDKTPIGSDPFRFRPGTEAGSKLRPSLPSLDLRIPFNLTFYLFLPYPLQLPRCLQSAAVRSSLYHYRGAPWRSLAMYK